MASAAVSSAVGAVGVGTHLRFTYSPYCGRCGPGVECWRAWCTCWGPMARHGTSRVDAAERAARWEPFHVCGLSPYDRVLNRDRSRAAARVAHANGLLP